MANVTRMAGLALLLTAAAPTAAQETEAEAVALLREGNGWRERIEGINAAYRLRLIGPDASPDLRAAVINAAWAGWTELRPSPDTMLEGIDWQMAEADLGFLQAVEDLRHPDGIPFLIEVSAVVSGGQGIPNHLADFGPALAFEPVLTAVSDPDEHPGRVRTGLAALRFMLGDGVLSAGQVERTRVAARERLAGTQDDFVVRSAVRLALALGDPELRATVERIAADRTAAEALILPFYSNGEPMTDENYAKWVDRFQNRARIFLDGGPEADIGPWRRRGGGGGRPPPS